ncbi:MAG: trimethylamine methyltransferase family protein [Anaerolineae bacterium]|jgi:trimethylamine--corrinoid protein Co-methyltransferase
MVKIEPIESKYHLDVLTADELAAIQASTLDIMEHVGVRFPSERALSFFAEAGASVDWTTQVVRLSPEMVYQAMAQAPRSYVLAGRADHTELLLDGQQSYFGTDGCGTLTVDLQTGQERPSNKGDVAMMARVADWLSSIAFYWPMVSAQDYGKVGPLHELDASFNSSVKHVQTETVMGQKAAQYAVRMAEVIAGSREALYARPPLSALICTIAPLGHDKEGIEAAMVYAQSGIPVGFMAMPTMGSTAPAAPGGALVIGNAEAVSAMVLMQLIAPGAPVFQSLLVSGMDPHTADYLVSLPQKYLCNAAAVQMAHDWGVPSLAGSFGLDAATPATWQLGRDSVYTALLCALAGTDITIGLGMLKASTLLVPEQILFDDEIYHTHRILAQGLDTSSEGLAVDVIASVGPGGHFLSQKHTRRHLRDVWIPSLTQPRPATDGRKQSDIRQRARVAFDRILAEHQPEPLERAVRAELQAILRAAERELA